MELLRVSADTDYSGRKRSSFMGKEAEMFMDSFSEGGVYVTRALAIVVALMTIATIVSGL